MSLISDAKSPFTIRLTDSGVVRLDQLKQRCGFRRTGALLTAVRVCSMAHCCHRNDPLYIMQQNDQVDRLWMRDCRKHEIAEASFQPVTLMLTSRERIALRRCSAKAGGLLAGIETALVFLETITADGFPEVFEKLGSQYYPLLLRRRV